MAISGGIKFFYKNYGDLDNESASASVSTGSTTRNHARSRKPYLYWTSEGSDDSTNETYELRFGESKTIDRIILNRHNFKAFTVQYWDGSAWAHFSDVVTKEGAKTNITETTNTKTTNYYEFTAVSTEKIQVSIDTTQAVDAEKYIYDVIATEEIGTLTGYPAYTATNQRSVSEKKALDGRSAKTILGESYSCSLSFQRYPDALDHGIMQDLWDLKEPFLIYPSGANEDQFRYTTMLGNRLRDIYLVNFESDFSPNYDMNVYKNALTYNVSFKESV